MNSPVIVSCVRTAVGKAPRGIFKNVRPDELAATAIRECINRASGLDRNEIEDVILGCAFPELEQGWNVARTAAILAEVPNTAAAMTINRFCSSGLQAIALACAEIQAGSVDTVVAGGVESMSMVPLGGKKICPNPYLMNHYPEYYLSMGLTAEEVATRYNVSREQQDEFAWKSCQKAEKAWADGKFQSEIVGVLLNNEGKSKIINRDEFKQAGTMETLSKQRAAFKLNGTVTAANSSPISDGAAACMIMSERKASALGIKPIAILKSFSIAGVDPDIMGIGPVVAIPKALAKANLKLADIQLIELNEAFAAQAIACINELNLDETIINVNGGAIALGHPLGCTGAKLTTTLLHEMQRKNLQYGLVSMCIGGGMGAAGVFELCK